MRKAMNGAGLLLGIAVTSLVVGCSSPQPGQAVPGPSSTATASQSASPSSDTAEADSTLAAVQPCTLLTSQDIVQFKGQGPGKAEDTQTSGATSACGWLGRSADDRSVSFGILIRAAQGVDELQPIGGAIRNGTVNSRTARQLASNDGGCTLTLKVGERSRVDISVVVGGQVDPTEACQIASNIANIIEPKLPPEAK
ncbi:DUF3558 family protein [Amycolatopsis dongchuanensis]|uniref:DUF3558 domain-containing protein n=1 Tax=Amycolatopsis dongchuanensis TaxID=1070866 RepID=A0ABP9R3U4_9PSEU